MTILDESASRFQKYRITDAGRKLRQATKTKDRPR